MFDIAPSEFLLVAVVALLVIGPKELPKAMRVAGYWVGKARGVARQFRSGFDAMVREAELAEMEKKWAEENARIMREHPLDPAQAEPAALPAPAAPVADAAIDGDAPAAVATPVALEPASEPEPQLTPMPDMSDTATPLAPELPLGEPGRAAS
ncbi:Sec-independent protein translocase protein TatB [Sphingomonas sp.]|uniref:Sec-independent protein translocase protein TatB n=1 Tax=Sphingomonas sp. TaxID=28214 RepID=UPI002BCFEC43|nr:Sec-independent protein translocase protein TatB [Sphingomonas sp.]HWK35682.1 Sec-independent protein translocase protein TatB [Sphingomonas sp.]